MINSTLFLKTIFLAIYNFFFKLNSLHIAFIYQPTDIHIAPSHNFVLFQLVAHNHSTTNYQPHHLKHLVQLYIFCHSLHFTFRLVPFPSKLNLLLNCCALAYSSTRFVCSVVRQCKLTFSCTEHTLTVEQAHIRTHMCSLVTRKIFKTLQLSARESVFMCHAIMWQR